MATRKMQPNTQFYTFMFVEEIEGKGPSIIEQTVVVV